MCLEDLRRARIDQMLLILDMKYNDWKIPIFLNKSLIVDWPKITKLWSKRYRLVTEWLLTDFEFTFDRLATHSLQPSTNFSTILSPTLIYCSSWCRVTFINTLSVGTWSRFHKVLDSIDFWLQMTTYRCWPDFTIFTEGYDWHGALINHQRREEREYNHTQGLATDLAQVA